MADSEAKTPRALGYFSLGLGMVQIIAPGALAELIGIKRGGTSRTMMRFVGAREIAAGIGILSQRQPTAWLWARVAGDLMDLTLLGKALSSDNTHRERLSAALVAAAGVTVADLQSAQQLSQPGRTVEFSKAIAINRQREDVYRFWRDFRNFPTFMSHLESVAVTSQTRSHWRAAGPAGRSVEWDAEIVDDRPDELIAWRSLPGADVDNSGSVRFTVAPGGHGTLARLTMSYTPPAGGLGATVARLFGQEPRQQVQADLRKLKQVLETGEVVRSSATLDGTSLFQPAAQPRPEPTNVSQDAEFLQERLHVGGRPQ